MPPQPKPYIGALEPAVHGGIDYREVARLRLSPDEVLDFSVCTNPCGPPLGVAGAIGRAAIERYPDSQSGELRAALASGLHVPEENIIVGSGSSEIIRLAALAYFGAGDTVIVPQPTYGDYEVACRLADAVVFREPRARGPALRLSIPELVRLIKTTRPRGVFLCNPNNPTGEYFGRAQVEAVLEAAPDALVVLDEAYAAFTKKAWSPVPLLEGGNLVVLRSMTKDYALAGVRLGYALSKIDIIGVLRRVQPPWSVNAMAQQAGLAALRSGPYLASCRDEVTRAKTWLMRALRGLGFRPLPSAANYFLVEVGDAARFRRALVKHGILVRDCTSFGLPAHVRIGVRTLPECRRLIEAVKTIGMARS